MPRGSLKCLFRILVGRERDKQTIGLVDRSDACGKFFHRYTPKQINKPTQNRMSSSHALDLDHLVIFIDQNLEQASNDYTRLGFKVSPGGTHKFGTFNQLIYLRDGKYLELVSYPGGYKALQEARIRLQNENIPTLECRWFNSQMRDGCVDFAVQMVHADDERQLESVAAKANMKIRDGTRSSGNNTIHWKLAIPGMEAQLPFVIKDLTDRRLRVIPIQPNEPNPHRNGVVGISALRLIVPEKDFSSFVDQLKLLFEKCETVNSQTVVFSLKSCDLIVQVSDPSNEQHQRHLEFVGGAYWRPFEVELMVTDDSFLSSLNPEERDTLAHGVQFITKLKTEE